ncbi:MAG: DUF2867 domain-containing protein [Microbacterium sp.]
MSRPAFWSLAFEDMPQPDFADVIVGTLPATATTDPREWAEYLFSPRGMPLWVRVAMGVRQTLAPLIGVPRGSRDTFRVSRVEHGEALIAVDDTHLDFRASVGVDVEHRLVRVVTAVRLKGVRGRLYFAPVRLAHPAVVQSMLARTRRALDAG